MTGEELNELFNVYRDPAATYKWNAVATTWPNSYEKMLNQVAACIGWLPGKKPASISASSADEATADAPDPVPLDVFINNIIQLWSKKDKARLYKILHADGCRI